MFTKSKTYDLPKTVDEVVDLLISDLHPEDRATLSRMSESELLEIHSTVGAQILEEFQVWAGNDDLLLSCVSETDATRTQVSDPSMVIIRKMWLRVRKSPSLQLVS